MSVDIEEEERQMIVLALAVLSVMRPGYAITLEELSKKFSGVVMLREFQKFNVHLNAKPWATPEKAKLYHGETLTLPDLRELAGLPRIIAPPPQP